MGCRDHGRPNSIEDQPGLEKLNQMDYLCERRNVADEVFRIRDTLDEDRLGLVIDGSSESFGGRFCDPLDADPIMLERHFEKINYLN